MYEIHKMMETTIAMHIITFRQLTLSVGGNLCEEAGHLASLQSLLLSQGLEPEGRQEVSFIAKVNVHICVRMYLFTQMQNVMQLNIHTLEHETNRLSQVCIHSV